MSEPNLVVLIGSAEAGRVHCDRNGVLRFEYSDDWRRRDDALHLSLSMPLGRAVHGHDLIHAYLWGLLPDNEFVLTRWSQRFQVSTRNAFALLAHVGEDCAGAVQFVELKHGIPVPLSRFQVDLSQAVHSAMRSSEESGATAGWTGDVEPIGFPFRFGMVGTLLENGFDFDQSGEWLLTASSRGILHAWRVDGSQAEILPRGVVAGEVLTQVDAVLGIAGSVGDVGWFSGYQVLSQSSACAIVPFAYAAFCIDVLKPPAMTLACGEPPISFTYSIEMRPTPSGSVEPASMTARPSSVTCFAMSIAGCGSAS